MSMSEIISVGVYIATSLLPKYQQMNSEKTINFPNAWSWVQTYLEPEPVKRHGYTSRSCRVVVTECRMRGEQRRRWRTHANMTSCQHDVYANMTSMPTWRYANMTSCQHDVYANMTYICQHDFHMLTWCTMPIDVSICNNSTQYSKYNYSEKLNT